MQDHANMTRRSFAGAMGAAALVAAGGIEVTRANASEKGDAPASAAEQTAQSLELAQMDNDWSGPGSADGSWTGTSAELEALGGSNMPLEELNRRRQAYVDAQTDYTCSDGTVIPAVFVKARALMNTYGYGMGNEPNDHTCMAFYTELTEDEAQAYLDMPWGVHFTVADYSEKSGMSLEDCERYAETLFEKGYVNRTTTDAGTTYGQVGFSMRYVNYHLPRTMTDTDTVSVLFAPMGLFADDESELAYMEAGTPWFSPLPASPSVVKDGAISPYDDIDQILRSKNRFAVAPCVCRGVGLNAQGLLPEGYPEDLTVFEDFTTDISSNSGKAHIETCLSIGEEAQALIELGAAREITLDEALEIVHRAADEGLVLDRAFSKNAECICCCDRDTCLFINTWKNVAKNGSLSGSRTFKQVSHYTLEVDLDSCLKCGTCVPRCPMEAITMDGEHNGESGYPQVSDMCFRCGQCAYVCPAEARKLVPLPAEDVHPYPATMFEEGNEKAAERFEHGLIY